MQQQQSAAKLQNKTQISITFLLQRSILEHSQRSIDRDHIIEANKYTHIADLKVIMIKQCICVFPNQFVIYPKIIRISCLYALNIAYLVELREKIL